MDLDGETVGWRERADGGPVRLRRNGRSARARGLYFSVKSGRHLPYESHLELHDLWRAEVDVEVVRSWPQPFTLTYVEGDGLRRYTPDRKDERADGGVEVVEVEERVEEVSPERAAAVAEALTARGWRYRVRDRSEIEREPVFSAVRLMQRHRRTAVTAAEALYLHELLKRGPRPFSEVLEALAGGSPGLAKACALVVRRVIAVDLKDGLIPSAPVRAL